MKNRKLRRLTACAMVAALYTVLALSLPMASFGAVQFRYAEALTLLPVFSPWAGVGVTAGCLLTNAIGFAMGLTFPQDILFGTLATLWAVSSPGCSGGSGSGGSRSSPPSLRWCGTP